MILSDVPLGTVLDLVERQNNTHCPKLPPLSKEKRTHIKTMTIHRWWPSISSAQELLAERPLIHDRFHGILSLNKAINQVQPEEVKQHAGSKRIGWLS